MKLTKIPVKPTEADLLDRPDAPLTPEGFFADGPTPLQYWTKLQTLEDYPPDGYAIREDSAEDAAKLRDILSVKTEEPKVQQQQQQRPDGKPLKLVRKHYEAHNSNRAIHGETRQYHFSPYAHLAGTWMGTYSTEDPVEQAELDKLVKSGKHGVYEMSDLEFENALKKKGLTLQSLGQSLIHSEQATQRGQTSAKAADPLDTEPKPEKPPTPESASTIATGDSRVPDAENAS